MAALLAIPSDRYHRLCLAAVVSGLVCLYIIAGLVPVKDFYTIQAGLWIGVAALLTKFNAGWKSVTIGCILLVVAGIAVFPAWLGSAALVPFTNLSLVLSGVLGVGAIIAFGSPGLRRAVGWAVDMGRSLRGRRVGYRLRDSQGR